MAVFRYGGSMYGWTDASASVDVFLHHSSVDAIALLFVAVQGDGQTIGDCDGWARIYSATGAGSREHIQAAFYRIVTQADFDAGGDVTFSFPLDFSGPWEWWIDSTFGGADLSDPIGAYAVNESTADGTSVVAPSVTTTRDGCYIIEAFGGTVPLGTNGPSFGTLPATSRGSWAGDGNAPGLGVSDQEQEFAGATGTHSATMFSDGGGLGSWVGGTIALQPPPPCVPPANDDWANAEVFVGTPTIDEPGVVCGSTVCASAEVGETTTNGTTVWYSWTPTITGVARVDVGLALYLGTHVFRVWTGASLGTLVLVSEGANSAVWDATAGVTYWVQVDLLALTELPYLDDPYSTSNFCLAYSLEPAPPDRNLMARTSGRGRLGCGVNQAYLTWKCGAPRYCSLPDSTEITYSRALNDISEATVVVTLSGSGDEECCDCLGDLEPWCHELHIARDGEVAWLGPVTEVFYDDDKVTINAVDLLGWATERVAEVEISNATMGGAPTYDLSEFGREILLVAFAEDDPCAIDYLSVTATGMEGARTFDPYVDTAFDQLDSLAQTGAPEYTVVGRTIILSGTDIPTTPIATLLDTHIVGPVRLVKSGLLQANRWFVHYADDDTDTPPGPGVATAADQFCYGLLEKVRANDAGIPDKTSAEQAAADILAATTTAPRLLEVPDGSQLSPEAPWTIDKMIPGARVDVSVNRLCVDATQSFRLVGMSVRQDENGEKVTISLGPLDVLSGGL